MMFQGDLNTKKKIIESLHTELLNRVGLNK